MKKFIKRIVFKIFPKIKFKRSGERQVASEISDIRIDHVGRYKFASNYIKPNTVILDIACGVGYGSNLIASKVSDARVVGVDIDKDAIAYAEKHYAHENVEFIIDDAHKPNLPENDFDYVISFETLEHLPNPDSFIASINRVIKKDGLFIFSSPNQKTLPFEKEKISVSSKTLHRKRGQRKA
ncbi:MAG: class I SAM-dependent methyltransferase [Melioribacteraceae bacterium]|nr:class I SAM-dependent methyltransferase [Melioribacteraceae bacterium]